MLKEINMFIKITCDKCGFSQAELEPESNKKFFEAGWSMNGNAKKYIHKCRKCNGKNVPVDTWRVIESGLVKYPLIKSIINVSS